MKKFTKHMLQLGFLASTVVLIGCQKKIAEEKNVDTSENIFTGSKTVTTDTDTKYQDTRTDEVTNKTKTKTKTKKVKYDKKGNKISESTEMNKDKE